MKSEVKCSQCGIDFLKENKDINRAKKSGMNLYCSHKCYGEHHKNHLGEHLGIGRVENLIPNNHRKEEAQKLGGIEEIQPQHYGTGKEDYSYRSKAFEVKEHKCERCYYNKIVGVLEVHHKDRNRNNNDIENLEILCPTCHDEEHYLTKSGKWSLRACSSIGKTSDLHSEIDGS